LNFAQTIASPLLKSSLAQRTCHPGKQEPFAADGGYTKTNIKNGIAANRDDR